jgi:hypothetical protein
MRGEGSWSGEGVPGKAMLGAESVALSFAPRILPPPACPLLPRPLSLLSALARSARPIPSPCSFASRDRLRFLPALSLLDRVFARPFPGKTLSARAFRPGATRPCCERSRDVPVFHRVAGLAPGNPARSRRWTPRGPGGPKAARRPQGRVTVLVAVLVTVLVTALVTVLASARVGGRAGGDRTRPGFLERLRMKKPRPLPDPGAGSKPQRWTLPGPGVWRRRGGLMAE